ncbi:MAG: hypothetical protein IJ209_04250 [Bacteroidaceae bacterium]|nr:hypothetical protein [Bacteroidaceae bacterium]
MITDQLKSLGKAFLLCIGVIFILLIGSIGIVCNNNMKYQYPVDFSIDSIRMINIEIDDSLFADKDCYLLDFDASYVHYKQRQKLEIVATMRKPIQCIDSIVDIGIYSVLPNDSTISIEAYSNKAFDAIESVAIYDAESKDSTLMLCDKYSTLDDLKYTIQEGIHRNQLHRMEITDEGFCLICFDKVQPRPNYVIIEMGDKRLRGEVVNAGKPHKYKLHEINY